MNSGDFVRLAETRDLIVPAVVNTVSAMAPHASSGTIRSKDLDLGTALLSDSSMNTVRVRSRPFKDDQGDEVITRWSEGCATTIIQAKPSTKLPILFGKV